MGGDAKHQRGTIVMTTPQYQPGPASLFAVAAREADGKMIYHPYNETKGVNKMTHNLQGDGAIGSTPAHPDSEKLNRHRKAFQCLDCGKITWFIHISRDQDNYRNLWRCETCNRVIAR